MFDTKNEMTRELLEDYKLIMNCTDSDLLGLLCSFVDRQRLEGWSGISSRLQAFLLKEIEAGIRER